MVFILVSSDKLTPLNYGETIFCFEYAVQVTKMCETVIKVTNIKGPVGCGKYFFQ